VCLLRPDSGVAPLRTMADESFLSAPQKLFIRQRKELTEILLDWETHNQYAVMDEARNEIATVVEKAGGLSAFLTRGFLRSHRPLEIGVVGRAGDLLFRLSRSFFFLFSHLEVIDQTERVVGSVQRRFGLLYRKYDLHDADGTVFATIRGAIWRIWTFPVMDSRGVGEALISKKWGGGMREIFTDADTFMIDFGSGHWSESQRRVIFAAAISIDFDFFENNQGNQGMLN
jgi:uncharacterized protein YxjI